MTGYALYPGDTRDGFFEASLESGVTVVIGANGIGKSTLVALLRSMLSGPFYIQALRRSALGDADVEEVGLPRRDLAYFAARVNDGAKDARARIEFDLGGARFTVERRLTNLSLVKATVDAKDIFDEDSLREELFQRAGVGSYSDYLLLMNYITFVDDSRSALIWDKSAQRQVLRPLFLAPSDSVEWLRLERDFLTSESERRNLSATLTSRLRRMEEEEKKTANESGIRERLNEIDSELARIEESQDGLAADFQRAQHVLDQAKLERLLGEDVVEVARREVERERLEWVFSALPDLDATNRFLIARAIGTASDKSAGCPLCGSELNPPAGTHAHAETPVDTPEKAPPSEDHLHAAVERVSTASARVAELESNFHSLRRVIAQVADRRASLEKEKDQLVGSLPANEQWNALSRLTRELQLSLTALDEKLLTKQNDFSNFVAGRIESIQAQAAGIQTAFSRYASAFLVEDYALTYSTESSSIGQRGFTLPLPTFSVQMSGTDRQGMTERATENSVSESQREFIDLSFRLALLDVAGQSTGSVVLDSIEASLDSVFEPYAADELVQYAAQGPGASVILTSNLTSGTFIPQLTQKYFASTGMTAGLVDLFEEGRATAATRKYADEYAKARLNLVHDAKFDVNG
ncbi:AAA family ATPase [Curtobacterium flaccumfaciens]|uniref:ATP-binding protein n=1 Tax=Curtobacterium flaccumfaciens TaxID=2035 RepID=UPI003D9A4F0E